MNSIPELTVTLTLGTRSRRLSMAELADALGVAVSRPKLLAAVRESQNDSSAAVGDTGGSKDLPTDRTNENENAEFSIPSRNGNQEASSCHGVAADPEAFALELADRLDDPGSLDLFRLVARELPESLVRNVLDRALSLPAYRVRRSRGAYFTAIVYPHLGRG